MRIALLFLVVLSTSILNAQSAASLAGWRFEGALEAEPTPGCEGCGNRGMVNFRTDTMVDYLLPGSDMVDREVYTRKGDRIMLEGGKVTMELRGDSLFLEAFDHRYPYVRVRRME